MKYVSCMGGIWRLSEVNYKELMRRIAFDEVYDLDILGKMVVSNVDEDITDMTEETAKEILADMRKK